MLEIANGDKKCDSETYETNALDGKERNPDTSNQGMKIHRFEHDGH